MQDDEQVTAPEADASAPGDMNGYRMLLFRASHAQRQLMHPFMASVGLGTGQPKLLSYLAEYGSSSPRDMADFYELDPAGVSRMLDALAGKGFVKIEPHAADRRSKVVSLTPEGARVACAWNAACAEEAEAMLAGFAPEEREAFADYLRRAHTNLRAYGSRLQASAAAAEDAAAAVTAGEDAAGAAVTVADASPAAAPPASAGADPKPIADPAVPTPAPAAPAPQEARHA